MFHTNISIVLKQFQRAWNGDNNAFSHLAKTKFIWRSDLTTWKIYQVAMSLQSLK